MGLLILGERARGDLSSSCKWLMEGAEKKEPDSSQRWPAAGQEAQTEIWEIPFKRRKKLVL